MTNKLNKLIRVGSISSIAMLGLAILEFITVFSLAGYLPIFLLIAFLFMLLTTSLVIARFLLFRKKSPNKFQHSVQRSKPITIIIVVITVVVCIPLSWQALKKINRDVLKSDSSIWK